MQKISKYNSSIMAGHKLKQREERPDSTLIDGKRANLQRNPAKLCGKGAEQIKVGLYSDDILALEAYCEKHNTNRQGVIREAIREYMKGFYGEH